MVSNLHGMKMDNDNFSGVHSAIEQWRTMQSPFPVLTVTVLYLLFVLKIGPYFMRNRKPYDLKGVLLIYNFIQVFFSIYLWASCVHVIGITLNNVTASGCKGTWIDPTYENQMATGGWWYVFAKFTELLDTVFFVLRKKTKQITFLHVYHHSIMLIGSWIYLKYAPSEAALVIVFLNSIVHTIMYSYYAIAALGPKYTKYIWWKKYMTTIQLIQFVLVMGYLGTQLITSQCPLNKTYRYFMFCNTTFFFYLFLNFYRNSYTKKQQMSKKLSESKMIVTNEGDEKTTVIERDYTEENADSIYKQSYLQKNGKSSMVSNISGNGSAKFNEEEIYVNGKSDGDIKPKAIKNTNYHTTKNIYSRSNKDNDKLLNGDSTLVMRIK